MNLNKYIISIIFTFLITSVFTQENKYPVVTVIESDTVIIFDVYQGKKLIKINEQKKECEEVKSIYEQQILEKDTIINNQKFQISNLQEIVTQKDVVISSNKNILQLCEDEKKILKKEIRKQKIIRWVAIGSGVILTVLALVF